MTAQKAAVKRSSAGKFFRQVPMTLLLLIGMIAVFAILVGPSKYLKISNIMNVISQCSSGVGIVALASFIAICSTGVDLSLGGIVSLAGMLPACCWSSPSSAPLARAP